MARRGGGGSPRERTGRYGRYGARVYLYQLTPRLAVIKQTVRRGDRYVAAARGEEAEWFVPLDDDRAVARALRRVLAGRL